LMTGPRKEETRPVPHLALQAGRETLLDEVDALLLRRVSETGSLVAAAKSIGISYRNAWGRIKRMEARFGLKILSSSSGGATRGGSSLTPEGVSIIKEFRRMRRYLFDALEDQESAGNVRYKLSARNLIRARVSKVERGDITSLVKMVSTGPVNLTSIISNDAVDDLGITEGEDVDAVVKSTEVMIAKRDGLLLGKRAGRPSG
jgi:molybdate transport system regulatory protein